MRKLLHLRYPLDTLGYLRSLTVAAISPSSATSSLAATEIGSLVTKMKSHFFFSCRELIENPFIEFSHLQISFIDSRPLITIVAIHRFQATLQILLFLPCFLVGKLEVSVFLCQRKCFENPCFLVWTLIWGQCLLALILVSLGPRVYISLFCSICRLGNLKCFKLAWSSLLCFALFQCFRDCHACKLTHVYLILS